MLDLTNLTQYRENNRIEAKKALGGLPRSIWETYSAFANTLGGIILLGVEELKDHSFRAVNLPDPERLVREFWELINDSKKVNVNILSDRHVQIETVDGCRIIVITVPKASRYDKPVYIDGNPGTGTYRRNGEGDYRCTKEEIEGMQRDASVQTQDMKVLEQLSPDALNLETLRRYRIRMKNHRPNHAWLTLDHMDFLHRLGAVARCADGKFHPTAAGLLMFGYETEIVKEFPSYFLDYQEFSGPDDRISDRLISSSGKWSGNLYDFYTQVIQKLTRNVNGFIHQTLHEALANSLIHADYYGKQGIVIIKQKECITISNPGAFRIDIEAAKSGGFSDPRNAALTKMFHLVHIGTGSGSGISTIYTLWNKHGWNPPTIHEHFEPDRTHFSLSIEKAAENHLAIRTDHSRTPLLKRQLIIDYLTVHTNAGTAEIAEYLGLKPTQTRKYLHELLKEGILDADICAGRNIYRLKY